jgi:hypothetical protein
MRRGGREVRAVSAQLNSDVLKVEVTFFASAVDTFIASVGASVPADLQASREP